MSELDSGDALRELLRRTRTRLADLTRDYAGIVEASRDSNADDEHDPEGSTIAFERSQVGALVDGARRQIDEAEAALLRLEAGTYGVCERCGEPLAPGRLDARPTARTCIECAG
jgi:RNA polymerase-binding transcription factor DksA